MDIVTLGAALNGSAEYVNSHFKGGSNIQIVDNPDGTQTINASGEVSSEDTVARAEIATIKDGETLDSFGDVETALDDKADTSTTYTKTEVDTALSAKADKSTTYTKTEVDTVLDDKVDKVSGKGLSTNDFTTAEKTKLAGIAQGAEVNVQSNWTQTTTTADDYIKNKPTLGTAAAKNATDTYNATGTDVTTGKAVAAALATLPEPMVFKGSLGTGGTITTLPTASSSNKGYVYKVITAGTYASQVAKVGDTFISDGSAWVLIPSGDEPDGTVTNVAVANGGGLTVSGSPVTSSGTITVGHSNSVTAKTSSSLKKFTYDAHGHVTGSSELSTAESDALASGINSTKVAQIETNKNNILSLDEEANALANNDRKNIITLNSFPMIVDGVTITQDLDTGELVFNGTASGTGFRYAYIGNATIESGKMYGFVDSLYGGNALYAYVGSTSVFNEQYPAFLPTRKNRVAIADGYPPIVVRLLNGTTYNNQRLSPMIFAGEITDNTYQPPAETNAHLTQQLQYAQFRRIKDDTSTVTFNLKRTDAQGRYHYGFVLFGNVTNLPSIYAVFIGSESTNPTVSFAKVGGGIEGALTGSVEYNGLNVTLTITSTSTLYGGIRLVWLD